MSVQKDKTQIEVSADDLSNFHQLHHASQTARLTFADAAASAVQQLAPFLLKLGETNKDFKEGLQLLAEKYRVPQNDADGVWELQGSKGFVRHQKPDTSTESE
jgi:hypothetical protein